MTIKQNQSVVDQLIQLLPNLNIQVVDNQNKINQSAARMLYELWRSGEKINKNIFKKSTKLGSLEYKLLEDEGLAKIYSDRIEITKTGNDVIKVMILGDDRSIFEDNGVPIAHNIAIANINTKNASRCKYINKIAKTYEDMWWDQLGS